MLYEFGGKWSEDCLFANVFAPTKATNKSKLAVYVFIQGGGFNNNGNANLNGSDLVRASGERIVVVNFNYRVGPYGFLASQEVVANKSLSLNNGLKDQRQLLKWVNKYINQVSFTLLPSTFLMTDEIRSSEAIPAMLPSAVPAPGQALSSSSSRPMADVMTSSFMLRQSNLRQHRRCAA